MSSAGNDPIRILFLIHGLGLGGAEHTVYNLACEIERLGCAAIVYAWRRGGPREPQFRAANLTLEVPGPQEWTRLRTLPNVQRLLSQHRVDLIHAHLSDSAFWGVAAQQITGVPCVVTHHSTDLIDSISHYRVLRRWLLLACARRAAANVAVSDVIRMRLKSEAGVPPERLSMLGSGIRLPPAAMVDSSCAARSARAATGFERQRGPRILFIGRMTQVKGVETLIDAAPHVLQAFPNATFVLVGGGTLLEALRLRARQQGFSAHFDFVGPVTDVTPFLDRADLFASASRLEGLSSALIEAMSWGVPVVASDIDGHRELVRPGETGVLVPVDDPTSLGAAIVNALRDRGVTGARARRARQAVCESYGSDALALRHLELYRRVLREHRR